MKTLHMFANLILAFSLTGPMPLAMAEATTSDAASEFAKHLDTYVTKYDQKTDSQIFELLVVLKASLTQEQIDTAFADISDMNAVYYESPEDWEATELIAKIKNISSLSGRPTREYSDMICNYIDSFADTEGEGEVYLTHLSGEVAKQRKLVKELGWQGESCEEGYNMSQYIDRFEREYVKESCFDDTGMLIHCELASDAQRALAQPEKSKPMSAFANQETFESEVRGQNYLINLQFTNECQEDQIVKMWKDHLRNVENRSKQSLGKNWQATLIENSCNIKVNASTQ